MNTLIIKLAEALAPKLIALLLPHIEKAVKDAVEKKLLDFVPGGNLVVELEKSILAAIESVNPLRRRK